MNTWQFNGVVAFDQITSWCWHNLPNGHWHWRNETIYFYEEQSYTLFLLRWAG